MEIIEFNSFKRAANNVTPADHEFLYIYKNNLFYIRFNDILEDKEAMVKFKEHLINTLKLKDGDFD